MLRSEGDFELLEFGSDAVVRGAQEIAFDEVESTSHVASL
jgi:hypothetical protein